MFARADSDLYALLVYLIHDILIHLLILHSYSFVLCSRQYHDGMMKLSIGVANFSLTGLVPGPCRLALSAYLVNFFGVLSINNVIVISTIYVLYIYASCLYYIPAGQSLQSLRQWKV